MNLKPLYYLITVPVLCLFGTGGPSPEPSADYPATWAPIHACIWAPDLELGSEEAISPYDHLFKEAAAAIGWDWRLVAAMVYHESRFHNEAHSARGAIGLMQILSERYTEEELLDPARNLAIGTRYLHRLEGMYEAATPLETKKFALAAYNLGEGKVSRLIEKTKARGLDATRWDNVAKELPAGHHTVAYVNKVLDTYFNYIERYR